MPMASLYILHNPLVLCKFFCKKSYGISKKIPHPKKQLNLDIEKKKLVLPNPIRNLGVTNVPVKLHPKVTGSLKVWVKEEA